MSVTRPPFKRRQPFPLSYPVLSSPLLSSPLPFLATALLSFSFSLRPPP